MSRKNALVVWGFILVVLASGSALFWSLYAEAAQNHEVAQKVAHYRALKNALELCPTDQGLLLLIPGHSAEIPGLGLVTLDGVEAGLGVRYTREPIYVYRDARVGLELNGIKFYAVRKEEPRPLGGTLSFAFENSERVPMLPSGPDGIFLANGDVLYFTVCLSGLKEGEPSYVDRQFQGDLTLAYKVTSP